MKNATISTQSVDAGEKFAVFYEEQIEEREYLVAVLFFSEYSPRSPVEQRIWRQSRPLKEKDKRVILDAFDFTKAPIHDNDRRRIPWGRISAEARAVGANVERINALRPPTDEVIQQALSSGDLAGFRSTRDFVANGVLLRATKEYLLAVVSRSETPTQDVAKHLGVDNQRAKNMIQRSRRSGYFDVKSHDPTPDAIALADKYWELASKARKNK